jgi:hypothetical protein
MTAVIFNWYGPEEPFGILSVVPGYLSLRVNFTKPATNDSGLRNPENYNINVDVPSDAFDFGCVSVTPEDGVTYPTYVVLEMTDNTHGKDYELEITAASIQSFESDPIQDPYNKADFVGVSEMPAVLVTVPLSLTLMRVTFTKIMALKEDLYTPTRYAWTDSALTTLKVEEDTDSSVLLTTTLQVPGTIYELTVG